MGFVTILLIAQVVALAVIATRVPSMWPRLRAPVATRLGGLALAWLVTVTLGDTAGVVVGWVAIAVVVAIPVLLLRLQRRFMGRDGFRRVNATSRWLRALGGGADARRVPFTTAIVEAVEQGRLDEVARIDEQWRASADCAWRPLFVATQTGDPAAVDLALSTEPTDAVLAPFAISALVRAGHLGVAVDRYLACDQLRRFRQNGALHDTWADLLAGAGRVDALQGLLDGPLAFRRGRVTQRWLATAVAGSDAGLSVAQRYAIDEIEADVRAMSQMTPPSAFDRWRPTVTWGLLAAIAVGWANQLRIGSIGDVDSAIDAGARVTGLAVEQSHQWWRVLSAMFVHGGWLHLALNSVALLVLGPVAEWRLGHLQTLVLFLGAGAGAFALQSTWHDTPTVAVGASGGIMALLGALVVTSALTRRRSGSEVATRELRYWVLFAASQLVVDRFVPNVDRMAHISGLVLGAVMAMILSRIRPVRLAR